MKKLMFLILSVILSQFIWAQSETNTVVYSYDAAGNRTKRELLVEVPKLDTTKLKGDSAFVSSGENNIIGNPSGTLQQLELINKYGLKVFPNPTEGKLNLLIENYTVSLTGDIRLYSQGGSLLWMQKSINSSNDIDLASMANGTYMLQLFIENKGVQWKIIKK